MTDTTKRRAIKRTPPVSITEAELRALRTCVKASAWTIGTHPTEETCARALARVDREARTEERRNAAAYLLSKSDVVPDGSGNWPPLAEAAHAIVNGEHAKDAAYGSLTPEIYARVDGFADARRALAKLSGLSMKKEKRR